MADSMIRVSLCLIFLSTISTLSACAPGASPFNQTGYGYGVVQEGGPDLGHTSARIGVANQAEDYRHDSVMNSQNEIQGWSRTARNTVMHADDITRMVTGNGLNGNSGGFNAWRWISD